MLELNMKDKLTFNTGLDLDIRQNGEDFFKIVKNVVKRGMDYQIRGLDINDTTREGLDRIKEIFKGAEFKNILKTAIGASVKQGLEITNSKEGILKNLNKFKDISLKGGLNYLISAGIDIVVNKFLKGNIFAPVIKKVLDSIKNFLHSNSFVQKIDKGIKDIFTKTENFKNNCKEWYEAYENFNIDKINEIASNLNKMKNNILKDRDCIKENSIIQNMTELINNKKDKLTNMQFQICSEI